MGIFLIGIVVVILMYFSTIVLRMLFDCSRSSWFNGYLFFLLFCLYAIPVTTSKYIFPDVDLGEWRMYLGWLVPFVLMLIFIYIDKKFTNELASNHTE